MNSTTNSKTSIIISIVILLLILSSISFWLYSATNTPTKVIDKKPSAQLTSAQTLTSQTALCSGTAGSGKLINYPAETISKLKIEDTTVGTGDAVKSGDTVCIHYKGTLENGTEFDTSYKRNKPFVTQIGVGSVIVGWDVGIVGLKEGGKRKLTIPAELGYGKQGAGSIPANSTLIFEVELVKILSTK